MRRPFPNRSPAPFSDLCCAKMATIQAVDGAPPLLRSAITGQPSNHQEAAAPQNSKIIPKGKEPSPSATSSHLKDPPPSRASDTVSHHGQVDSEGELEEEEDILGTSIEGDEVGKLLRTTVSELEAALQDSRKLLAERDEELGRLRSELEHYKQQAAKEIANKTKLAQALDESHGHARELEELLQTWQLELRESKLQGERLQAYLQREQAKSSELERRYAENIQQKEKEVEQLKSQLIEARQKLSQQQSLPPAQRRKSSTALATDSNPGPEGMDESKLQFLKQAVFHLLTDFHADDQLRAIISILDFSAQERKAVYAKTQEKKKAARGLY